MTPAMYEVGDPDPTPNRPRGIGYCSAGSHGYVCTWAVKHTHPQHVAGDGRRVIEVWPVTA